MLASTVNTAPVTLRLVSSIVSSSTCSMAWDAADLAKSATARVSCLRGIGNFALEMGAKSSAARASIRLAIMLPNNPASESNCKRARAQLVEIASTVDAVAAMFAAVPSLMGQEVGKNAHKDSVCGRHIANAIFGTESVSASRQLLKGLV